MREVVMPCHGHWGRGDRGEWGPGNTSSRRVNATALGDIPRPPRAFAAQRQARACPAIGRNRQYIAEMKGEGTPRALPGLLLRNARRGRCLPILPISVTMCPCLQEREMPLVGAISRLTYDSCLHVLAISVIIRQVCRRRIAGQVNRWNLVESVVERRWSIGQTNHDQSSVS